ncbi:MAG: hypothetical protein K0R43_1678 [Pseudoduganella sp.]|jgi:hypothetical protein|nr:hypothetical protein [Pseudoduganella sp.]
MIHVSELSGAWLDYWVARAEGVPAGQLQVRQVQRSDVFHCVNVPQGPARVLDYSTNWERGGPIIQREVIKLQPVLPSGSTWYGTTMRGLIESNLSEVQMHRGKGETPLVAAMRCYVASKFGEEVPEVTP